MSHIMEEETKMESETSPENKLLLPASIVAAAVIIAGGWAYATGRIVVQSPNGAGNDLAADAAREEEVLPSEGVELPVRWGDLGARMVASGVIDAEQFEALYESRARLPDGQGGMDEEEKALLYGKDNGNLKITRENAGTLLNLLWALGLGNKNDVLEKGPMADEEFGGAGVFASTGGWTLAKGDAMSHYSMHRFVALTADQQALVERVSQNIYRPCCGNSTYFPDCNHGMAMLGLLELMASQGVSEADMYRYALAVNSYWFPDTYLTVAKYLESQGVAWRDADPRQVLGYDFSSAAGYRNVLSKTQPQGFQGGGGCGV